MRKYRGERLKFNMADNNKYEVVDREGKLVFDSEDDYYIYMKNVNLCASGEINGRMLGFADDLYIPESSEIAIYNANDKMYTINGKKARTARMVALRNKDNVLIVVGND